MLNLNNNAANIKREILVRIAELELAGKLTEGVHYIPREMAPKDKPPFRCCIYHDREILRMRVLARLGCSVEEYDDDKPLSEYAEEALKRKKPTWPMLTVLHDACNGC
ncbi:MAG: Fe-hydrogenase large subunit family protein, partial [Treponema sp.]|nr:Fe-hydrogenase large subunit family protein [Treponema sp.]